MFISQHWWAVYRRRSAAEATLAALLAYTSALQQAQQDGPSLEQLHCCWNSGNFGVMVHKFCTVTDYFRDSYKIWLPYLLSPINHDWDVNGDSRKLS